MAEWAYVIRSSDRESFKRCRRAWDLSARERQNYEPVKPAQAFDFGRAIRDALAVYYFPGMWEWNRAIVLPLALEGFLKSMRAQKETYIAQHALTDEEEQSWNAHLALGKDMLGRYFRWAPAVDRFSPIQVGSDFEVNIPDPLQPGRDLAASESTPILPIRYRGQIDLLAVDEYNAYWIIDHRIAGERWEDIDYLLLDDRGVSYCWALENFFLGMKIAGVIYNELRKDVPPAVNSGQNNSVEPPESSSIGSHRLRTSADAALPSENGQGAEQEKSPVQQHRRIHMQSVREPDPFIKRQGNEFFRRTQVPRSRTELENFGSRLALEALDMTDPEVRLYPNPSKEICSNCAYRPPCIAMNEGSDSKIVLETSYRKRSGAEFEPGRLGGSTFSMDRGGVPPKFGAKD